MAIPIVQLRSRQRRREAWFLRDLVAAGGVRAEQVAGAAASQLGAEFVTAAMIRLWTTSDALPGVVLSLLAAPSA